MLEVHNNGAEIESTNYWQEPIAAAGKLFCSVNHGTIRVLIPPAMEPTVAEMKTAKECILSRGPWPDMGKSDAVEILFDDSSASPFALHLTPESFDLLPAAPEPGREWMLSVWTQRGGQPHKEFERICHWRRVAKIPCLEPWNNSDARAAEVDR